MENEKIVNIVREFLNNNEFMQAVFQSIFNYDKLIGYNIDGNYNINANTIYPIQTDDENIYSIITFNVDRENGMTNDYSLFLQYDTQGASLEILYPGTSNTDYHLFNDIYPVFIGMQGNNAILKDTKVIDTNDNGWSEEWTVLLSSGEEKRKIIDFISSPESGTTWAIRN